MNTHNITHNLLTHRRLLPPPITLCKKFNKSIGFSNTSLLHQAHASCGRAFCAGLLVPRLLALVVITSFAALTLTAQKGKTQPRKATRDTTKTVITEKGDTLKILIPPQDSIPVGDAGESA